MLEWQLQQIPNPSMNIRKVKNFERFALKNALRLHKDSITLFDNKSYPSAFNYQFWPKKKLVSPVGFEPTTHSLKGCRSTVELRAPARHRKTKLAQALRAGLSTHPIPWISKI